MKCFWHPFQDLCLDRCSILQNLWYHDSFVLTLIVHWGALYRKGCVLPNFCSGPLAHFAPQSFLAFGLIQSQISFSLQSNNAKVHLELDWDHLAHKSQSSCCVLTCPKKPQQGWNHARAPVKNAVNVTPPLITEPRHFSKLMKQLAQLAQAAVHWKPVWGRKSYFQTQFQLIPPPLLELLGLRVVCTDLPVS